MIILTGFGGHLVKLFDTVPRTKMGVMLIVSTLIDTR